MPVNVAVLLVGVDVAVVAALVVIVEPGAWVVVEAVAVPGTLCAVFNTNTKQLDRESYHWL